jgi:hypothetical protein
MKGWGSKGIQEDKRKMQPVGGLRKVRFHPALRVDIEFVLVCRDRLRARQVRLRPIEAWLFDPGNRRTRPNGVLRLVHRVLPAAFAEGNFFLGRCGQDPDLTTVGRPITTGCAMEKVDSTGSQK